MHFYSFKSIYFVCVVVQCSTYFIRLTDRQYIVNRLVQEYFIQTETSPSQGCKTSWFEPLSKEGSLSCRTFRDTGPRFSRSHPRHSPLNCLLRHPRGPADRILIKPPPPPKYNLIRGDWCMDVVRFDVHVHVWCGDSGRWV